MPRTICAWTVTAGIMALEIEGKYTKQFFLLDEEWRGPTGLQTFVERSAAANAYASYLQLLCAHGREVNWTQVEFVWF